MWCENVEPIVSNSFNWEKKAGSRLRCQVYFPKEMTSYQRLEERV